jgi:hypothetical protein
MTRKINAFLKHWPAKAGFFDFGWPVFTALKLPLFSRLSAQLSALKVCVGLCSKVFSD